MSTLCKELALRSIDINMDCERQQYLRVLPIMVIQIGSSRKRQLKVRIGESVVILYNVIYKALNK